MKIWLCELYRLFGEDIALCQLSVQSNGHFTSVCSFNDQLEHGKRKLVQQVANTSAKCQMFVSRCELNAAQPSSAVRRPLLYRSRGNRIKRPTNFDVFGYAMEESDLPCYILWPARAAERSFWCIDAWKGDWVRLDMCLRGSAGHRTLL